MDFVFGCVCVFVGIVWFCWWFVVVGGFEFGGWCGSG